MKRTKKNEQPARKVLTTEIKVQCEKMGEFAHQLQFERWLPFKDGLALWASTSLSFTVTYLTNEKCPVQSLASESQKGGVYGQSQFPAYKE